MADLLSPCPVQGPRRLQRLGPRRPPRRAGRVRRAIGARPAHDRRFGSALHPPSTTSGSGRRRRGTHEFIEIVVNDRKYGSGIFNLTPPSRRTPSRLSLLTSSATTAGLADGTPHGGLHESQGELREPWGRTRRPTRRRPWHGLIPATPLPALGEGNLRGPEKDVSTRHGSGPPARGRDGGLFEGAREDDEAARLGPMPAGGVSKGPVRAKGYYRPADCTIIHPRRSGSAVPEGIERISLYAATRSSSPQIRLRGSVIRHRPTLSLPTPGETATATPRLRRLVLSEFRGARLGISSRATDCAERRDSPTRTQGFKRRTPRSLSVGLRLRERGGRQTRSPSSSPGVTRLEQSTFSGASGDHISASIFVEITRDAEGESSRSGPWRLARSWVRSPLWTAGPAPRRSRRALHAGSCACRPRTSGVFSIAARTCWRICS
jgi:hypothetical protein